MTVSFKLKSALLLLAAALVAVYPKWVSATARHDINATAIATIPDHKAHLDNLVNEYFKTASQIPVDKYTNGTKYIICEMLYHGMGNRLPSLASAFALALFTGRRLIITTYSNDMNVTDLFTFPVPMYDPTKWYRAVGGFIDITHGGSQLTRSYTDPGLAQWTFWVVQEGHYAMPFLQVNPSLSAWFAKHFPSWDVFQPLMQRLIKPVPRLQAAIDEFAATNFKGRYVIALQIRTMKIRYNLPELFNQLRAVAATATGVTGKPAIFFVLSDDASLYGAVAAGLGHDRTCWTDNKVDQARNGEGNPGTFETTVVDMYLMSMADDAFIALGSSFGSVAAALSGLKPTYVTGDVVEAREPYPLPYWARTWYWKSWTSEPCAWTTHHTLRAGSDAEQAQFRTHPHWQHHAQCYYVICFKCQ